MQTTPPGWPEARSPYHAGEQALQARAGMRERAERAGRKMIRDFVPEQHRELFERLPFLLVGSLDAAGRPWASILTGAHGFLRVPEPRCFEVEAPPLPGDPLEAHLRVGAPLGLLGIEPETRRRNRLNGKVSALRPEGFRLQVGQSFGNCPQYIQARRVVGVAGAGRAGPPLPEGPLLSAAAVALVRRSDTLFIASAAPGAAAGDPVAGVDVSHRGGRPGFVRVEERAGASLLTLPDFRGNYAFNTFGNLVLNPAAGLLFLDFESGDLLSLSGEAEVIWDGPELAAFAGAQRLLRLRVAGGLRFEAAVPLRWSAPAPAPQLAATGTWEEVARRLRDEAGGATAALPGTAAPRAG